MALGSSKFYRLSTAVEVGKTEELIHGSMNKCLYEDTCHTSVIS